MAKDSRNIPIHLSGQEPKEDFVDICFVPRMTQKPQFIFPVATLHGEDFQLEPFDVDKHATAYWEGAGTNAQLYAYMSIGPWSTLAQFVQDYVHVAAANPATQLYAIMTSRKPKHSVDAETGTQQLTLAGIVGFMQASDIHLRAEIGPIILLSQYQGIGLAPDAVELMVQHAFRGIDDGGWGIRRVCYMAHTANQASIKLARRLKFQSEGVMKWEMVLRDGNTRGKIGNGRKLPPSSDSGDVGRDTEIFSRYWDD